MVKCRKFWFSSSIKRNFQGVYISKYMKCAPRVLVKPTHHFRHVVPSAALRSDVGRWPSPPASQPPGTHPCTLYGVWESAVTSACTGCYRTGNWRRGGKKKTNSIGWATETGRALMFLTRTTGLRLVWITIWAKWNSDTIVFRTNL